MNPTFTETIAALVPTGMLLVGSALQFSRRKGTAAIFQLIGAACLMVVIIAHARHSIGFPGCIGALSTASGTMSISWPRLAACRYFQLAICLERLRGRWHRYPAGQLMLLDFAQHRLDVDDRRAVDVFHWPDSQTVLAYFAHGDLMKADRIGTVGRSGGEHSSKPSLRV
jgi:hypothetical protein